MQPIVDVDWLSSDTGTIKIEITLFCTANFTLVQTNRCLLSICKPYLYTY